MKKSTVGRIFQAPQTRAATRVSIGVILAALICFALHLQTPYWACMTVIFVTQVYSAFSISKGLMRLIGTIIGAALGFYLAGFLVNSFYLFLFSSFMVVSFGFYYHTMTQYAYAFLLAAITCVLVSSFLAINPNMVIYVAIWRPIEIGVGVLVATFCSLCIFPNRVTAVAEKYIHDIIQDLADGFELANDAVAQDKANALSLKQHSYQLKMKIKKLTSMIAVMHHELYAMRSKIEYYRTIIIPMRSLARSLYSIALCLESSQDKAFILSSWCSFETIFGSFSKTFQAFSSSGFEIAMQDLHGQYQEQFVQYERYRQSEEYKKYSLGSIELFHNLLNLIETSKDSLEALQLILYRQQNISFDKKYRIISKSRRLYKDKDVIIHSIKAGITIVIALSMWIVTNWPGGINGIISSILISMQKNIYAMKTISLHRALGCIIGGTTALLMLRLTPFNFYDLIVSVFVFTWLFMMINFHAKKYSYIGLQAAVALVITLMQGQEPTTSLAPPLERLGGIFIGIFASFLVGNVLWRNDLYTMYRNRVNKLYRLIRYNLEQALSQSESQQYHDCTTLIDVLRGLEENLQHTKDKRFTSLDKSAVDDLVCLMGQVHSIRDSIDVGDAHHLANEMGINLKQYEQIILKLFFQHDSYYELSSAFTNNPILKGMFKERLRYIRQSKQLRQFDLSRVRNLIAFITALRGLVFYSVHYQDALHSSEREATTM